MDIRLTKKTKPVPKEPHQKKQRPTKALQTSEENYRLLAENISDVVWVLDTATLKFKYISPSVEKMRGYTVEEEMAQSLEEHFAPESLDIIKIKLPARIQAFLDGNPLAITKIDEMLQPHKDGSTLWTEIVSTVVKNKEGGLDLVGVSRNISKRKLAEKKLREDERRNQYNQNILELLVQNASLATLLETLVGAMENELPESKCSILLADRAGEHLLMGAAQHLPDFYNQAVHNLKIEKENGSCGTAAYLRERVIVEDIQTHAYWAKYREITHKANLRACWSEPILSSKGVLLGTFAVYYSIPRRPQAEELESIRTIVNLASIAIERKNAENALSESESRHRQISELTSDYVYRGVVLPNGNVKTEWISGALEKITGYTLEELNTLPHGFVDMIPPEDLDTVLSKSLQELEASGMEYRIRRKDGQIRWLKDRMKHQDVDAEIGERKLIGAVQDITARKQAELALIESEEKYRTLAEELEKHVAERTNVINSVQRRLEVATKAAELGIWDWNLISHQLIFDEQMHIIYGTSPETFNGTIESFINIVHPEDAANLMSLAQAVLSGDSHYHVQYRIIRQDKSVRHIKAYGTVLSDANNMPEHVIGVVMDITQDKEAEETLRLANLELERAMRVKDEFLANMSHELRTPLNAILGISESLIEQVAGNVNEKQEKYLSIISESGHHLLNLINDILDLSKIGAGRLEMNMTQFSTEALCQSSLRMIKELAQKKQLTVSLQISENAGTVYGDERRIKQILVNLLSNAVKFSPEGKSLGLNVTGNADENQVTFTVWDTGIGISKENLSRLFKPFVQLDSSLSREAGGTGLGLMLVSQLARLHGGNVTVESEPGKGSCFKVNLPWNLNAAEPSIEMQPPQPNTESAQNKSARILLVEDTEPIIMYMQDYLESKGHHVTVARNGYEGIMFAKNLLPDIILMDIQMPSMDGFEATKRIKSEPALRNIPIIALTALAMPGDQEKCMQAGMNHYMSKPIDLKELHKLINKYTHSKGEPVE